MKIDAKLSMHNREDFSFRRKTDNNNNKIIIIIIIWGTSGITSDFFSVMIPRRSSISFLFTTV